MCGTYPTKGQRCSLTFPSHQAKFSQVSRQVCYISSGTIKGKEEEKRRRKPGVPVGVITQNKVHHSNCFSLQHLQRLTKFISPDAVCSLSALSLSCSLACSHLVLTLTLLLSRLLSFDSDSLLLAFIWFPLSRSLACSYLVLTLTLLLSCLLSFGSHSHPLALSLALI